MPRPRRGGDVPPPSARLRRGRSAQPVHAGDEAEDGAPPSSSAAPPTPSAAASGDDDAWLADLLGGASSAAFQSLSGAARAAARQLGRDDLMRLSRDVVRLALFTEYRQAPLRRDAVSKKVLGKAPARAWPAILEVAQHILRTTFGMELAEMRPRGAENPLLAEQARALDERVGTKRRRDDDARRAASSGAYILRSILPPHVVQALVAVPPDGAPPVAWQQSEGALGAMGLQFVVLALILLHGRQAPEAWLRTHLAQLSLSMYEPLPSALHAAPPRPDDEAPRTGMTLEAFLGEMLRHGYLEKVRVRAPADDAGAAAHEWRWGARAELEIGERAVAAFLCDLYADGAKLEDADGVRAELQRRIERAAGSSLVG